MTALSSMHLSVTNRSHNLVSYQVEGKKRCQCNASRPGNMLYSPHSGPALWSPAGASRNNFKWLSFDLSFYTQIQQILFLLPVSLGAVTIYLWFKYWTQGLPIHSHFYYPTWQSLLYNKICESNWYQWLPYILEVAVSSMPWALSSLKRLP